MRKLILSIALGAALLAACQKPVPKPPKPVAVHPVPTVGVNAP
ncbi:hypothetical protein AB4Z19_01520 [Pseudoduganella sp. RAF19]